ncbi:MAG: hypothetical protein ACT6FG_00380 [Methanosarcinaceae archaeon]
MGIKKLEKTKWKNMRYEEGSPMDKAILSNKKVAASKTINEIIKNQPKTKEDQALEIFETFVNDMDKIYPETKDKLEHLRPLIFIKLLKNAEIGDSYYKFLKEL